MIILKSAVEDYLNRPLNDSAKAKRLTHAQLDAKIAELGGPPFVLNPRKHQKVSYLLGCKYSRYLLLLDMGLGKSMTALQLFRHACFKARKESVGTHGITEGVKMKERCLVLAPNATNLPQWEAEIAKHAPELACGLVNVQGSSNRMQVLRFDNDVTVITYMGLLSLVCDSVKKKLKNGKTVVKWEINKKRLKDISKLFNFVIFDECDAFENPQSLMHKASKKLSWSAQYAYGLTGTPLGNNPEALWGTFNVIDKGETLGRTLAIYRAALFKPVKNYWTGYNDYKFDKTKTDLLARMIRHRSIRYDESECDDLPKKVKVPRPVIFAEETWTYYNKLVDDLVKAKAGPMQLMQNAFVRMRQLTAGYLVIKDDQGGKHEIKFQENAKLEALMDDVSKIPDGCKGVIFHEYLKSGALISEALTKAKIKHVCLNSKTDGSKEVNKFLKDKSIKVMVSSSAGARGGNWQIANYMFFFESPVNPKLKKQEVKRCDRIGQTKTVFIYEYFVKGSVDQKILFSLKAGDNLFKSLVDGKKVLSKVGNK